jgi:hypothetical protein
MRNLAIAVLGLAVAATAQSPLLLGQPLTSANQGNPGGGIYFDLQVNTTLTINSITYVASDASGAGNSSFRMFFGPSTYVGNTGTAAPWVEIGTSAPVAIPGAVDTTVVGVLSGSGANAGGTVTFAPGNYGIALVAVGHSWGYQNGVFTFSNADLTANTGGASNTPFVTPTFSPRSINGQIDYTLGGTPIGAASKQDLGVGCYASYQSFYEEMGNTATNQDLSNQSVLLSYQTNGTDHWYNVTLGNTAISPAGAAAQPVTFIDNDTATSVDLTIPLNFVSNGGLVQSPINAGSGNPFLQISPECFCVLDAGPCTGGNPVVATKFSTDGTSVGNHIDCDSQTTGGVTFEFDGATANQIVTWNAVASRGQATTNTVQIVFFPNNDIEIRFGTMDVAVGGAWPTVVGYITGNGALDPGTIDLGTAAAGAGFSTGTFDQNPLRLDADVTPQLGSTVTLTTSDEPTNPGAGLLVYSVTPAVTPLAPIPLAILGAPGCFANVLTIDATATIGNFAPLSMSSALPIPNNQSVVGNQLGVQAAWLDPSQNAFGVVTSNGVLLTLGN